MEKNKENYDKKYYYERRYLKKGVSTFNCVKCDARVNYS